MVLGAMNQSLVFITTRSTQCTISSRMERMIFPYTVFLLFFLMQRPTLSWYVISTLVYGRIHMSLSFGMGIRFLFL